MTRSHDDFDFEAAGAAAPFPSEAEWLAVPAPPFAEDFVERTLAAIVDDAGAGREPDLGLARGRLAAFGPGEPSADFVERTLQRLRDDRRARWRALLARHVAPDPSPEFVQRTLAALARDRGAGGRGQGAARRLRQVRFAALPLLAAAAAAVWFGWLRQPPAPPFEQRIAATVDATFAHAEAASPLPALFAALDRRDDGEALPTGNADGHWLWREARR